MRLLNADDIRRIVIELLNDLEKIQPQEIQSIQFIDEVAKTEILSRLTALKLAEIIV